MHHLKPPSCLKLVCGCNCKDTHDSLSRTSYVVSHPLAWKHTYTTIIEIIHLICETFSAKNLTSVYTSPPPLCLQWPQDIWALYPSISTLQGKQRGWECRSRSKIEGLLPGEFCPFSLFPVPLSLSSSLSYTHLVLTCFVQICVWARHPELSLMDLCFLASHFPRDLLRPKESL